MDDSAAPPTQFVRLEVVGGVGTIRLDRPPVNAMNALMQDQLHAVALEAGARDDVRAVVIYGGTRSFAAGADVKEMAAMTHADMVARAVPLQAAFTAVAQIPKPVVAAITGYALGGGCELALAADVRFCADGAKLGQPEILLGVIPGAGGTQRLARLVGRSKAIELMAFGTNLSVEEAQTLGLVNAIVEDAGFDAAVAEYARRFVPPNKASKAVGYIKRAVVSGLEMDFASGLTLERELQQQLFTSEDAKEGIAAYVDKRTPAFKGR
jgi:enoyl-CoA hydratase/carnithine racemase